MKKILLIILIAFGAAACTTEEYYTSSVDIFEKVYEIGAGKKYQWKLYDGSDGLYYYCEINEPVLSDNVYYDGSFIAYQVSTLDGVGERLTPLPYDVYSEDKSGNLWTVQYTCEFSRGLITFIVKVNDFVMDYPPNQTFLVKYIANK